MFGFLFFCEPLFIWRRGATIGHALNHLVVVADATGQPWMHGLAPVGYSGVLDMCNVTRYTFLVIKSFADRRTESLFVTGRAVRVPVDLARRAVRKLEYVHVAARLDDLRVPPGNRLHALKGDRKGQYAIAVNDQWRICFRFADGDAYDVEVCDYH